MLSEADECPQTQTPALAGRKDKKEEEERVLLSDRRASIRTQTRLYDYNGADRCHLTKSTDNAGRGDGKAGNRHRAHATSV